MLSITCNQCDCQSQKCLNIKYPKVKHNLFPASLGSLHYTTFECDHLSQMSLRCNNPTGSEAKISYSVTITHCLTGTFEQF